MKSLTLDPSWPDYLTIAVNLALADQSHRALFGNAGEHEAYCEFLLRRFRRHQPETEAAVLEIKSSVNRAVQYLRERNRWAIRPPVNGPEFTLPTTS